MAAAETIPGVLFAAAERDPDKTWLRTDDSTLTFAEAALRVGALRRHLLDAGIGPQDIVMLTTRNTPSYLLCWLALASMGAIALTVDPKGTAQEFAGFLRQVRPRCVISDDDLSLTLAEADAVSLTVLGVLDIENLLTAVESSGLESIAFPSVNVGPDDVAVLIPTSGTTGRSKLVMQTHRAYAWAGEGFPYWMELAPDDRLMTSLPLFHINAPAYSVMGSLHVGAGLILLPGFSAGGFLDSARRHGATEFNAIGAMLEILARQPERSDDASTDLRLCYTGPSPTREWQESFEQRFGLCVVCGYAMSESPFGLIWPHGSRPYGTLGSLRQHPRLGVVNSAQVVDDSGSTVPPGQEGELWLSNPVVTPGYWNMPEETATTISDGWLHTGDLVTRDSDETYTFVARKKEVLRRRGQNMSPLEIEEVIAAHADVREVTVVGVASELTEDDVKAFIVAEPGHALDFLALRDWTSQRLSAFKVPRFWQAVPELPRTPTARVAKHRLPTGHPADEFDYDSYAQQVKDSND
jgi:carnitine-CoA ligase